MLSIGQGTRALILGVAVIVGAVLVFFRDAYAYPLTMTAEEGCIAQALMRIADLL